MILVYNVLIIVVLILDVLSWNSGRLTWHTDSVTRSVYCMTRHINSLLNDLSLNLSGLYCWVLLYILALVYSLSNIYLVNCHHAWHQFLRLEWFSIHFSLLEKLYIIRVKFFCLIFLFECVLSKLRSLGILLLNLLSLLWLGLRLRNWVL